MIRIAVLCNSTPEWRHWVRSAGIPVRRSDSLALSEDSDGVTTQYRRISRTEQMQGVRFDDLKVLPSARDMSNFRELYDSALTRLTGAR
jgi:hypothetical protein